MRARGAPKGVTAACLVPKGHLQGTPVGVADVQVRNAEDLGSGSGVTDWLRAGTERQWTGVAESPDP